MSTARRPQQPPEERRTRPRAAEIVQMPTAQPVWEQQQMQLERIGDILRRTRERRGDDLQAIADYLCIRRGFLEALEDSRYDAFPADAYVIGFLRSYADLLGLNSREAIDRYRAEMAGRRKKPSLVLPTPIVEGRSPSVFVLIGAVIAAILIYVVWYSLSTPDRASVSTPPALPSSPAADVATPAAPASIEINAPPPASVLMTPAQTQNPAAAEKPATSQIAPAKPAAQEKPAAPAPAVASDQPPTEEEADKPPHLVIKAQQSSWVMISDSKGDAFFDKVLKPGESYTVPDKPGLTLTTGNGTGITLTLDGVDMPKLSNRTSSGIMRDIPLDGGRLKNLLQPRD